MLSLRDSRQAASSSSSAPALKLPSSLKTMVYPKLNPPIQSFSSGVPLSVSPAGAKPSRAASVRAAACWLISSLPFQVPASSLSPQALRLRARARTVSKTAVFFSFFIYSSPFASALSSLGGGAVFKKYHRAPPRSSVLLPAAPGPFPP